MNIWFGAGATRFVILVGGFAIKFPRIRLIRPVVRLFQTVKANAVRAELNKYSGKPFVAAMRYLFPGVITNYWEWRFCIENPELDFLAPTYFSLFGLINIQKRGEVFVSDQDPRLRDFKIKVSDRANLGDSDILDVSNCCLIDGKIYLLDYGDRRSRKILTELNTQGLARMANAM